jgi:Tfp pilus assembly pilus retraction ATPase PilT
LALEAVHWIDALFEIERVINGQSPEKRKAVRQELSALLVADLEAWMREQRAKLSRGNDVAKAMDYMLKWLGRVPVHRVSVTLRHHWV